MKGARRTVHALLTAGYASGEELRGDRVADLAVVDDYLAGEGADQPRPRPGCGAGCYPSDLLDQHGVSREELIHVAGVRREDGRLRSLRGFPSGHGCQDGVDGVFVPVQAGCLQYVARHGDHLVVRVYYAKPGQSPVPQCLPRRFARMPCLKGRECRGDDRDVEPWSGLDQCSYLPIALNRFGESLAAEREVALWRTVQLCPAGTAHAASSECGRCLSCQLSIAAMRFSAACWSSFVTAPCSSSMRSANSRSRSMAS